ncbi:DUF411 domain-containing protein [Saliphagus infecundisoli]|uniref:DUF411 domain-containing protein n=1 Tax=Saliphagus infecundisoli TaxID=1849069 RepID=A0ABD5QHM6_9EURY|nr:DUF411 domain-containing protein [Saliphagus infecundisoli]
MPRSSPHDATDAADLSRRSFLGAAGIVAAGFFAGCLGSDEPSEAEVSPAAASLLDGAVLYRSPNCSCCLEYTEYLETNSGVSIDVQEVSDLAEVQDEYAVPRDVESCHTVSVGKYYVEGHVPLEAINELAAETPDVAGIALPGMPAGSPGMPGTKEEPFLVYATYDDGSYDKFVRV